MDELEVLKDKFKDELQSRDDNNSMVKLGKEYAELYFEERRKSAELKKLKETLEEKKFILIQKMLEDGINKFTLEGIGNLGIKRDPYLKIIDEERKKDIPEMLDSIGLNYLAPRAVNIRTLTAWYKDESNREQVKLLWGIEFEDKFKDIIKFESEMNLAFTNKKENI